MQQPITVSELLTACKLEMEKGNGNKHIYISNDDEGNGYHGMWFAFTSEKSDIKDLDWNGDISNIEEAIILG